MTRVKSRIPGFPAPIGRQQRIAQSWHKQAPFETQDYVQRFSFRVLDYARPLIH
jgi:hypothetical protein